jgi:hypothetical protein
VGIGIELDYMRLSIAATGSLLLALAGIAAARGYVQRLMLSGVLAGLFFYSVIGT